MSRLEVVCVTMHQSDFSKIKEMNIHSDVVFANQADTTDYKETEFDGYTAKMITTDTRGVGINRNLSLSYATGDILLLSDDDMRYTDTYKEDILAEFERHENADVIIFNITSSDHARKQKLNTKTKRTHALSRMPYGAPRIAMRRSAWQKSNVWFTTLFGGGAKFTSGEDSMFLAGLRGNGLEIWVSNVNIGIADMSGSSWFSGFDEKFFFGKGAYLEAVHPVTFKVWKAYLLFRYRKSGNMPRKERSKWMEKGRLGYRNMQGFESEGKNLKEDG